MGIVFVLYSGDISSEGMTLYGLLPVDDPGGSFFVTAGKARDNLRVADTLA
jgi:hypothetical protein